MNLPQEKLTVYSIADAIYHFAVYPRFDPAQEPHKTITQSVIYPTGRNHSQRTFLALACWTGIFTRSFLASTFLKIHFISATYKNL